MINELYPGAIEAIAQEDPEYAAELARKYRKAMIVLSREDPNWFCQYVLRNERTTGPIRQTDQHKLIHDHLMARDENGNWKNLRCEVEGSKVLLATGTWLPIEELRREWTPVLTWDTRSDGLKTVMARAAYNGPQKCVCVHLENGHILRLTENHPLLSDSWEWKQAKDLKVGQQVVTIRSVQLASTTDEREIPDDEAEILGYLLAGSLQGKNIIVRKLDRSPKWSARRAKLFEAAGWEITKHKEMTLRVTPGSGVMGPGDYLASLARFKNGWPVELMPSVWGLPASALHRLLSAFFATAFCNRKSSSRGNPLGQTVGSGSDRVPLGVGHIRRETLELIRLLMLRVGARGVIRPTKMFSFSDGGGIYRKAKRKGESNKFWQLRVDPKQVGLFWPTKQVPAEPPLWAFEKIVKITRTPHKLKTWALEVQDETHSYISGGVLSHNTLIWTYPEFGKGLPLDTEIPTPDGWQTMGELRVGEQIFGSNGAPANITSVSPIHNLRIFELRLDDGDSIRCDESHRWVVFHAKDRHKKDRKPRVITALEMFESQKYGDRTAWSLPIAAPVQYPAQELPVHPYVLGAWLGDGDSCRQRLTFHNDDRAIFDRCVALCGDSGSHETPYKQKPQVISGSIGGKDFKRRLKSLGVMGRSGSKFIPAAYLRGSVEQRLELLKGLLDTDGTVAKGTGGYIEVSFSLERLARNTLELVRSLGFKAHFSSSPAKLYGRVVGVRYRISFTARTPVFYLPRKLAAQKLTGMVGGKASHRHVVEIVEMPSVPTKCISVDSPDQTYLATRSYTVTHNSNQVAIGHLLWRIGKDPNASFGIMCNSERMAAKILRSIKAYIMESLELRDVFPHLKPGDQWSESAISVERDTFRKDPTVQAISLRGKFVGARLDGLVMDDVDNVDTTLNQSARDDTERRVRTQAISRLGDVGWAVAIGNVWHEGDLMHRLAKTGWKELRFPVMNEVTGESNDPERFPLERIYAIRDEDQGPIEFQRLYMLKARIDGEQRFRKEWVELALQKGKQQVLLTEGLPKIPSGCRTITGVDLGVKKKASSDPSAITTILEIPQDGPGQCEYILLNIQKGRWNAQEIMDKVREEQRLFASKVYVESNGAQDFLIQLMNLKGGAPIAIEPFNTGRNKYDPMYGVESIAGEMAMGKWTIPSWDGTLESAEDEVRALAEEMLAYTPGNHTGDVLMSLWIAREGARLSRKTVESRVEFGRLRLRR